MTIDKIDHPWAESGDLDTTLTDAKRDVGWVSGDSPDRPTVERFNLLQNETDTRINEIVSDTPPAAINRVSSVGLNLYSKSDCFGPPTSNLNRISVGTATSEIVSIYPTVIDGVKKLLLVDLDAAAAELIIFDIDTMTEGATIDLSGGLGAGTWSAQGVCADGTNAYVCFEDASYNQYVQAYNMSTWSVAAGWPASGTDYGTGSGTLSKVKIINADADFIAIATNNALVGTREMISLIDKSDGSIDDTGNGDSNATGAQNLYDLSSNGDDLFFYVDGELCSASISDLTTGCGGSNWPLTTSYGGDTTTNGRTVVSAGNAGITISDDYDAIAFTIVTGDNQKIKSPSRCAYDGMHFWLRSTYDPSGGSNDRGCVSKLYVEHATKGQAGLTADTNLENFVETFNMDGPEFGITSTLSIDSNLIHDGRDLFYSDSTGSAAYVVRMPLTHWR